MLIDSLIGYRKRTGHTITVVFDGWKTGQGQESRSVLGGVKLVYSRLAEKADDVIKRIISSERKEYIVVSSDRAIADYAWSSGCIPVPSHEFMDALERDRHHSAGKEEYDDEYPEQRRKGNPRRLSKKEKALRKATDKL